MEAHSRSTALAMCCLLTLAGCQLPNDGPRTRPEPPANPPEKEAGVVAQAAALEDVRSTADVEADIDQVQAWIEQIQLRDDLGTRVNRQTTNDSTQFLERTYDSPPETSPTPGVERVLDFDQQPPTSTGDAQPGSGAETLPAAAETPAAPILRQLKAREAASSEPLPILPNGPAATINVPAQSASHTLTLQDLTDQWLATTTGHSFRAQLDRRVLLVLAGNYEAARQPLETASAAQQEMAARFVETLIAIRQSHGGDPGLDANRVLGELEQLEQSLLPLSDLRIPRLALTRAVRGFGRYKAFDPPQFPAGRETEFVVYCELQNFLSSQLEDGGYESQFSMRTAVLNRAGDVVYETDNEHITDTCRTQRHDCFIAPLVRLPATLSPGEYVVKVTIVDKIGKKVAEERTTFRIVARS